MQGARLNGSFNNIIGSMQVEIGVCLGQTYFYFNLDRFNFPAHFSLLTLKKLCFKLEYIQFNVLLEQSYHL